MPDNDENICTATVSLQYDHAELTLHCDLYANHSMPRHRTVVDAKTTIFWEK